MFNLTIGNDTETRQPIDKTRKVWHYGQQHHLTHEDIQQEQDPETKGVQPHLSLSHHEIFRTEIKQKSAGRQGMISNLPKRRQSKPRRLHIHLPKDLHKTSTSEEMVQHRPDAVSGFTGDWPALLKTRIPNEHHKVAKAHTKNKVQTLMRKNALPLNHILEELPQVKQATP